MAANYSKICFIQTQAFNKDFQIMQTGVIQRQRQIDIYMYVPYVLFWDMQRYVYFTDRNRRIDCHTQIFPPQGLRDFFCPSINIYIHCLRILSLLHKYSLLFIIIFTVLVSNLSFIVIVLKIVSILFQRSKNWCQ